MGKVFISYSHKDKKWVRDYLLKNLEKNGISCHIDYRDFEIGKPSLFCMEYATETCEKTILIYSPNWVDSEFSQYEVVMLQTDSPLNLKKKFIPLLYQQCTLPQRLSILNYADFTDKTEWDKQLERVIKQIKKDFEKIDPKKKTYPTLEDHNIDITRLPQTGFELFGRHKELTLLNEAWASGATKIVSFVAYGGVGKSTLVNKWVEKMRWDNYRGAEKVYAWSFYSQGTSERVTSADMFINHALQWFGDENPKQGSAWDKGKRLAKLINNHHSLLILDGLEPLQAAEKVEKGKIKDPALATLVTELAKNNKGLCLITTREHVSELDRYTKTTKQENLEHISDEAGRKLLETRRIFGSEKELELMVQQFGNHALAINLLAEYLRIFENHRLDKATGIPDINIPKKEGKHARRIIEAFANHLGSTSAEFQLLSIMGLFDRPVPIDAINAIIGDNPALGLSDKITDTSGSSWLTTLKKLRKYKLIFEESEHQPDTLDCHPLIREHFGEKLEQQNPNACEQAHVRLYEYYKNKPEQELPDTLEEMEPLFAAVMHGCHAGRYQEALDEVYRQRIQRNQGKSMYIRKELGAWGTDLTALAGFFHQYWDQPVDGLTEADKSYVLNEAGLDLRSLGQLAEAIESTKASLETASAQKDWNHAAISVMNLSDISLTLGDVAQALMYAKQSIKYPEDSVDIYWQMACHTTLANVLHQAGQLAEADATFSEAEAIQKKYEPESLFLYSFRGFQYCDLLLGRGEYQESKRRAFQTLEIAKRMRWLLAIALNYLTLGQSYWLQAQEEGTVDFSMTTKYFDKAVEGLREAGQQDYLPRSLLARAALHRVQGRLPEAWADVSEVLEIAKEGPMKLHQADAYLELARVIKAQLANDNTKKEFTIIEDGIEKNVSIQEMNKLLKEHIAKAGKLIEETGYHRRDEKLEELKK